MSVKKNCHKNLKLGLKFGLILKKTHEKSLKSEIKNI